MSLPEPLPEIEATEGAACVIRATGERRGHRWLTRFVVDMLPGRVVLRCYGDPTRAAVLNLDAATAAQLGALLEMAAIRAGGASS